MNRCMVAILLLGMSVHAQAVPHFAAVAATSLAPARSRQWVVDYAASYCVLSRHGLGTEPGIAFRTRPFADEHDLLVYFARTGEPYVSAKGSIFLGNAEGVEHGMALMEPKGAPYRYLDTQISAGELTRAAAASSMRIFIKQKLDVTIPLPQMQKAIGALRKCEADLAQRWQAEFGWVKPPKPIRSFHGLLSSRDYPSVAFSRNQTGRVRTLLKVGATGTVIGCRVIESSGAPLIDKRTCDIFLARIRFKPALDKTGRPVASSYIPPVVDYRLVRRDW
jgi:TonB family protein